MPLEHHRPVGVILAAGLGSRLGPLGESYVKTLLPVADQPLVGHHLQLLRSLGVRRTIVVIGHHADAVRSILGDGQRWDMDLRFVEQSEPLGSAHALAAARPHVDGRFLLLLGDYYFVAKNPEAMALRLGRGESAIAVKRESNVRLIREACAVSAAADSRIVGIVEKPTAPQTDLKGCGFYALQPEAFDAVMRTPRTALRNEYELTVALELMLRGGQPIFAEEVIEWDNNVTRPEDLLQCNLDWLDRHGKSRLVAADADIDSGARVERTVVGAGAAIRGESLLREVVVFPGAEIVDGGLVERALVTGESQIFCEPATRQTERGVNK